MMGAERLKQRASIGLATAEWRGATSIRGPSRTLDLVLRCGLSRPRPEICFSHLGLKVLRIRPAVHFTAPRTEVHPGASWETWGKYGHSALARRLRDSRIRRSMSLAGSAKVEQNRISMES